MTMSRLPCKWLYKTRFGCYCNCSVFFQRRNFADESHCLGCAVYEPKCDIMILLLCKNYVAPLYCIAFNMDIDNRKLKCSKQCVAYKDIDLGIVKEPTPMIVCKYQNEQNDCTKSVQQFPCVFAQCNAWEAAKARCRYFEQTDESTLQTILSKIPEKDLEFLEYMFKTHSMDTLKQISLSLSGRYDP